MSIVVVTWRRSGGRASGRARARNADGPVSTLAVRTKAANPRVANVLSIPIGELGWQRNELDNATNWSVPALPRETSQGNRLATACCPIDDRFPRPWREVRCAGSSPVRSPIEPKEDFEMSTDEFRDRCRALGAQNPGQAARVLGISRTAAWLVWRGRRRVTDRTEMRLVAADVALTRVLASDERRVLEQGRKPGDHVPPPAPRSNFDLGTVWDLVYDGLHGDGFVRFGNDGKARITTEGLAAIRFYQSRIALMGRLG